MRDEKRIFHEFVELVELISNSKTKPIVFEGIEQVFYRGEVHIIQIIGDNPGIFSSELARKINVSRAVVHKSLLSLVNKDLVLKEKSKNDKKKYKLYLSDQGKVVHQAHEMSYNSNESHLVQSLKHMTDIEIDAVADFIDAAKTLFISK